MDHPSREELAAALQAKAFLDLLGGVCQGQEVLVEEVLSLRAKVRELETRDADSAAAEEAP
jgi:hypothetical protein